MILLLVIGYAATGQMLFVVHIELEDDCIRIISARHTENDERQHYEYS